MTDADLDTLHREIREGAHDTIRQRVIYWARRRRVTPAEASDLAAGLATRAAGADWYLRPRYACAAAALAVYSWEAVDATY
jgi:hypothetical protein